MANLSDLFNYRTHQISNYSIGEETQFRVRAFLLGFQPQNINEFCVAYCHNCQETYSFAEIGCNLCPVKSCGDAPLSPVFKMVLYLKDEASLHMDEAYKIMYYSSVREKEVKDCKLFGFEPCNLYQDQEQREKIKQYLHMLC